MNEGEKRVITLANIERAIQEAESQYYRLVLLVGPTRSGKTPIIREVAERLGRPVINVNLAVTEELLDCAPKKRPLRAQEVIRTTVEEPGEGPVLLGNIEVLFDPDLKLDPLRVLHALSRNRTLLVAWPGKVVDGKLCYATREHPEFRQYPDPDAILLEIEPH